MIRRIAVLRPEPGNRATIERLRAAGLPHIAVPLFQVAPLAWTPPDPASFDRILLTSANALRHGGHSLGRLAALPAMAVGAATAAAARTAGFDVIATGSGDLADLLRTIEPGLRLLWLAGEDRTALNHPALAQIVPVYRASPALLTDAQAAAIAGGVALLHSARAAAHFAGQIDCHAVPRAHLRLAAISAKAASAAGGGWGALAIAATPDDDALITAARALAIDA